MFLIFPLYLFLSDLAWQASHQNQVLSKEFNRLFITTMFLLFSLQEMGTSFLVSTNTASFDFCVLDKLLQTWKLLSASYQKRKLAGKLPLHSFLVPSLFKSSLNTLSTSLNSLSELSYLHTGGQKAVHLIWDSVAMARQCKTGNWQTLFFLS